MAPLVIARGRSCKVIIARREIRRALVPRMRTQLRKHPARVFVRFHRRSLPPEPRQPPNAACLRINRSDAHAVHGLVKSGTSSPRNPPRLQGADFKAHLKRLQPLVESSHPSFYEEAYTTGDFAAVQSSRVDRAAER